MVMINNICSSLIWFYFLVLLILPQFATSVFDSPLHSLKVKQHTSLGLNSALDPIQDAEFDPYSDNAGTTLAIAGKDFCIVAADTRLSDRYMIRSRNICRLCQVGDGLVFTGSGCWADILELSKVLESEGKKFRFSSKREMDIQILSHLISNILYSRRFFPYYTFSTIAGIDKRGQGAVFHYDALGSGQRVRAACSGRGEKMIQPLLDELTQVEQDESLWTLTENGDQFISRDQKIFVDISESDAVDFVSKAFRCAAEREISIGDGVDIWIIRHFANPSGNNLSEVSYKIEKKRIPLPRH